MKASKQEYERILEFLIKNGASSKYAISKGTGIPYPTILRKLPEMNGVYLIQKIGEGKRGAEIYAAMPKGMLIAYFHGRVRTPELFIALPSIMKHIHVALDELPAVKNPFGFLIGGLPYTLSHLEDIKIEEALSLLGAILIWRHEEWYHEIGKKELERLLSWDENYQLLRFLVAGSINSLEKMCEQAHLLSTRANEFLSRIDELARR